MDVTAVLVANKTRYLFKGRLANSCPVCGEQNRYVKPNHVVFLTRTMHSDQYTSRNPVKQLLDECPSCFLCLALSAKC